MCTSISPPSYKKLLYRHQDADVFGKRLKLEILRLKEATDSAVRG